MVEYVVESNARSRETPLSGVNRLGAIRRVPLSMIGGRLIEVFSPGVEKAISSLVSSRSASFVCKKAYRTPIFFDSKNLHNSSPTPGQNASNFVSLL